MRRGHTVWSQGIGSSDFVRLSMSIVVITGHILLEQVPAAHEILYDRVQGRTVYTDCGGWDILEGRTTPLLEVVNAVCPWYLHWSLDGNLHLGNPLNGVVEARWAPEGFPLNLIPAGPTAKTLTELALARSVREWYERVSLRDVKVFNFHPRPRVFRKGPETTPLGEALRDGGATLMTPYLGG